MIRTHILSMSRESQADICNPASPFHFWLGTILRQATYGPVCEPYPLQLYIIDVFDAFISDLFTWVGLGSSHPTQQAPHPAGQASYASVAKSTPAPAAVQSAKKKKAAAHNTSQQAGGASTAHFQPPGAGALPRQHQQQQHPAPAAASPGATRTNTSGPAPRRFLRCTGLLKALRLDVNQQWEKAAIVDALDACSLDRNMLEADSCTRIHHLVGHDAIFIDFTNTELASRFLAGKAAKLRALRGVSLNYAARYASDPNKRLEQLQRKFEKSRTGATLRATPTATTPTPAPETLATVPLTCPPNDATITQAVRPNDPSRSPPPHPKRNRTNPEGAVEAAMVVEDSGGSQ